MNGRIENSRSGMLAGFDRPPGPRGSQSTLSMAERKCPMIRFQHSIVRSARGGLTLAFALAVGMGGQAMGQAQMGTAFTYQGQLKQAGEPMNDVCDFRFSLWDDGGEQIGTTQFTSDVSVEGGRCWILTPACSTGISACWRLR